MPSVKAPNASRTSRAGKQGAMVRCNAKLRDMNVVVSASDERPIEVVASGLPFHDGAEFAIDVTLRSSYQL